MTQPKENGASIKNRIEKARSRFEGAVSAFQENNKAQAFKFLKESMDELGVNLHDIGKIYEESFLTLKFPSFKNDLDQVEQFLKSPESKETNEEAIKVFIRTNKFLEALDKEAKRVLQRKFDWTPLLKKYKKQLLVGTVSLVVVFSSVSFWVTHVRSRRGLRVSYFSDDSLKKLYREGRSQTVDYFWGKRSPLPSWRTDHFSIRWEGFIHIPRAGLYSFQTEADDGVRLWIGSELLIDDWKSHAKKRNQKQIDLVQGYYPLKLEYFDNSSTAVVILRWRDSRRGWSVIPASSLVPLSEFLKPSIGLIEEETKTVSDVK